MSSDRPSGPVPDHTPPEGYVRAGIIYIDDSELALQTVRRALYPHRVIVDTYSSFERFVEIHHGPVIAALLDVDLADGVHGEDVAVSLRNRFPNVTIAFLTADANDARARALAAIGPMFSKQGDLTAPVNWLLACASTVLARVGR